MSWGDSANIITTNMDAGTDSPAAARGNLKVLADEVIKICDSRGEADGVAALDSDGKIPQAQVPNTPVVGGRFVDGAPGLGKTWTVPAGVTRVTIEGVGAGGGGGYVSTGTGGDHGGGGGGGGTFRAVIDCSPGDDFSYDVGTAGTGKDALSDGAGADGDDTIIQLPSGSIVYTAKGGSGGKGPPDRFGGAGGYALKTGAPLAGSDELIQGGSGVSGATRGGAGGGSSLVGTGVALTVGGTADREGGAGGFGSGGSGNHAFDGLHGRVKFEW